MTSQAQSAYAEVRQLLLSGTYEPGERLAEVALAGRLGMSRTPVREALRRLEADGLVATTWRGVMVPVLAAAEIGDAYELRAALEALTGEVAARRVREGEVSPRALEALRAHAGAAARATSRGDLGAAIERNRAFHRSVAELAANPLVAGVLDRVWDRLLISTRLTLGGEDRRATVAREHDQLIAAIAAGRERAAGEIARAHVLATRDALTQA